MQTFILASIIYLGLACQAKQGAPPINREQDCMSMVLMMDDSLGKARNLVCQDAPLSQAILAYVNALKKK